MKSVLGSLDKEDANFRFTKDGTFFPLFCLTNPALEAIMCLRKQNGLYQIHQEQESNK
jgi:hypothetical protein